MPVPANIVANSLDDKIDGLLTQFSEELAKKTGVSNEPGAAASIVSRIRWYQNKAGAVVIVKRGKDRKVLATISPKSGEWSHLYPSWEPVLAELAQKKAEKSVSRLSHDGLRAGEIPE